MDSEFRRYSFSGPKIEDAVLHTEKASYDAAIESGHKDTYAPEAWEEKSGGGDEEAEKTELKAKLKEAGIAFGGNTGIAKLRELVASIQE